jgi:peroxiredoxin-like protein
MSEPAVYYYATEIEWSSERAGILQGPNLPVIVFGAPPEFKGREGQWAPEHLFVSAVNACFMLTFLAVAENSSLPLAGFSSTATGKLEKVQGGGYQFTEIVVKPRVIVAAAKDVERVPRILGKAKDNCFIANSIKSSVKVEAEILHRQERTSPDVSAATPAAGAP